jgi:sarcosine oxidase subunit beta
VELPGPPEPLPAYASVTIIGGGAMGVSTALHLAENGVGSIVVIERDLLGSGSSAKPLGGVRATFSDPGNILLAQRSLEAYERFGAEFGVDIGLRQVGYLFSAGPRTSWPPSNRQRNCRTTSVARPRW